MAPGPEDPGVGREDAEGREEELAFDEKEGLGIDPSDLEALSAREVLARHPKLEDPTLLMEHVQTLRRRLRKREQELDTLREIVAGLTEEIDRTSSDRREELEQPRVDIQQLFTSLADALESAKVDLRTVDRIEGGGGVDIADLEIELKGGLDVSQEAPRFIQLRDEQIGPESVSTLRFRLRPRTEIRIASNEEEDHPSDEE